MLRLRTLHLAMAVPLAVGLPLNCSGPQGPSAPAVVPTRIETPVLYDDDAGGNASGDDPAICVHPGDRNASIVVATAKEGGLRVYDLTGAELQSVAADPAPRADGVDGRYNNADIAYGCGSPAAPSMWRSCRTATTTSCASSPSTRRAPRRPSR